jgi:signal transduction histidine kinase
MSAVTETPQIALARVDDLLNKVYVSGLVLLTADLAQNAFRQMDFLNPFWFWLTFGSLIISVVGATLAAFKFGFTRYWYRAMMIVVLVTMLTWAYQAPDDLVFPVDYKPWIWWAVGPVVIAAAGAWSRKWAYLSLGIFPILWLMVETSAQGGGTPLNLAIQDSLYTFFFSTVLVVMAMVLRDRASEVDEQNAIAVQAVLQRTRAEVMERERAIFNSILHDKVLTTLDLAARANSAKARTEAAESAKDAIGRLTREVDRTINQAASVSLQEIPEPLLSAVKRNDESFETSYTGSSNLKVPFQVAAAIYEATLLAAANSRTHAPGATKRKVSIRISERGIKVVVSDNGRGFRMSNVHKAALGVRWTIFKRLENNGVKAHLETKPGSGTTWIFEWYQ